MTLVNAFGSLSAEATQALVLAAIQQRLTDAQLRATALAVTSSPSPDFTATGTLSAAGQAVTIVLPPSASDVNIQLTGTFVGTVIFESSVDGSTWNARVYRGAGIVNVLETGTSAFPSEWRGNAASMHSVRVRCTAFTSGSLTVFIRASQGVGAIFLNAAIPIGSVSTGNSITAGTVAAGGTWTGVYERVTQVAAINVNSISTQDGTLTLSYSRDAITADESVTYLTTANVARNVIVPPRSEFVRVSLSNTGAVSATVNVEMVYRAIAVQIPMLKVSDAVPANALGAIGKAIVEGANSWATVVRNVTTTVSRVDSGTAGRRSVLLRARSYNQSNDVLYVGPSNAVGSGFGNELKERESISIDLASGAQVWAVGTRAAGNSLEVTEIWDA